jgi:hypothetical protein
VENIRTQSSAPQKLCTILSVSDCKPGNVAAALHVLELVLADVLEPEVRRVLAQVTSVTGVRLPRWRLQFVPTVWLSQGPGWLWEIEQVNAYASTRTR